MIFDNLGGTELLVVVFVVFLFFGPKKLPEIGRTLGKGLREFRSAMTSVRRDIEQATRMDEERR
jgi:sec-independent protein translocase protein TatA